MYGYLSLGNLFNKYLWIKLHVFYVVNLVMYKIL